MYADAAVGLWSHQCGATGAISRQHLGAKVPVQQRLQLVGRVGGWGAGGDSMVGGGEQVHQIATGAV